MVEMPMIPLQPAREPAVEAEAAAAADAPQGAFEEMLARRLGRQLVGRFAEGEHRLPSTEVDAGDAAPWTPPVEPDDGTPQDSLVDPLRTSHEIAMPLPVSPDGTVAPKRVALPPEGVAEPTPVRVHVNRPGFPQPMAEAGIIQPGPDGDVWTSPSGSAQLELTRGGPMATRTSDRAIPEPPAVHWSPAPARAALAAAANRDLELEIVSKLSAVRSDEATATPRLELVAADGGEPAAPLPSVATAVEAGLGASGTAPTAGGADGGAVPSTVLDRVLTAVEMQRHLPPPRSIAVDIPEMEGLRILVTMRMDGTVHLSSSNAAGHAAPSDQSATLLQAVQDALSERGFATSADAEGRRGRQDHSGRSDDDTPPRSFRFRRSARRASGLRI